MFFKDYYWYFKSALPHNICDQIIERGKQEQLSQALIGDMTSGNIKKNNLKKLNKTRNSNVAFINDQWIYNEILPFVNEANKKSGWNFELDWAESCQFTVYKKNQFYDWHCDSFRDPYGKDSDKNHIGKIRKLSVTVSLNDSKEYKGGTLEFQPRDEKNPNIVIQCNEILEKGSIVVFPSYVWHRVTPVTEGTRYSLVIWNLGKPFI